MQVSTTSLDKIRYIVIIIFRITIYRYSVERYAERSIHTCLEDLLINFRGQRKRIGLRPGCVTKNITNVLACGMVPLVATDGADRAFLPCATVMAHLAHVVPLVQWVKDSVSLGVAM